MQIKPTVSERKKNSGKIQCILQLSGAFCFLCAAFLVTIHCEEFISLIYKTSRPTFHSVGYVKENQMRVWEKRKGLEEENKSVCKNTNSS